MIGIVEQRSYWVAWIAFLCALFLPIGAQAAAGFKIELVSAKKVTVTAIDLKDRTCAPSERCANVLSEQCEATCAADTECVKGCEADKGQCEASGWYKAIASPEQVIAASDPQLDQASATDARYPFANALLGASQVFCGSKSEPAKATPVGFAPLPSSLDLDGGFNPDPDAGGTLTWSQWEDGRFAAAYASLLAKPIVCKVPQVQGVTCTAAFVATSAGVRLTVTYGPSLKGATLVELTVDGKTLKGSIQSCDFRVNQGLLQAIYAGASLQRLELGTDLSRPDCSARLGTQVRLTSDTVTLTGSGVPASATAVSVELVAVPGSLPAGDYRWDVRTAWGALIGRVSIPVVSGGVTVDTDSNSFPVLKINYAVDQPEVGDLNQWHTGVSSDGQAVVTAARGDDEQYVQNTATVRVEDRLQALAAALEFRANGFQPKPGAVDAPSRTATFCSGEYETCENLERKTEDCSPDDFSAEEEELIETCRSRRKPWRVRTISWDDDTWLSEDPWWYKRPPARYAALKEITFATFGPQPKPLEVEVTLVDPTDPAKPIFRAPVTLARGARYESLPLTLARALYVACGDGELPSSSSLLIDKQVNGSIDLVENGKTRAVNDEDIETGNCRLHFSTKRLLEALGVRNNTSGRDLLKYFGRQELLVTLARAGATDQQVTWSLDPVKDAFIRLPSLGDVKNASGMYTVTATLRGPLPPSVRYRPGPASTPNGTPPATGLADLEFRANLRPRGPFGWQSAPIRVFMTFPVNFTGLRFPAEPRDMKASSSPTAAQLTPVQAGVLVALEPWNYNTGRNYWPVPVRFMSGMNLFESSIGFSPSLVNGVSLTLPIIDLPKGVTQDQLGTDVALGVFWELDLRGEDWERTGHHLLVTLGLNVLSLFGSK